MSRISYSTTFGVPTTNYHFSTTTGAPTGRFGATAKEQAWRDFYRESDEIGFGSPVSVSFDEMDFARVSDFHFKRSRPMPKRPTPPPSSRTRPAEPTGARAHCAVCNRPIPSSDYLRTDHTNGDVTITVRCHGQTESVRVGADELVAIRGYGVAFKARGAR